MTGAPSVLAAAHWRLNNRHLFLQFWRVESKVKVPADLVSGEDPFLCANAPAEQRAESKLSGLLQGH